ncbi:hypothetical protein YC2023_009731 [Brassica napus]
MSLMVSVNNIDLESDEYVIEMIRASVPKVLLDYVFSASSSYHRSFSPSSSHHRSFSSSLLHQATTGASLLHQATTGASLMQRIQVQNLLKQK